MSEVHVAEPEMEVRKPRQCNPEAHASGSPGSLAPIARGASDPPYRDWLHRAIDGRRLETQRRAGREMLLMPRLFCAAEAK